MMDMTPIEFKEYPEPWEDDLNRNWFKNTIRFFSKYGNLYGVPAFLIFKLLFTWLEYLTTSWKYYKTYKTMK